MERNDYREARGILRLDAEGKGKWGTGRPDQVEVSLARTAYIRPAGFMLAKLILGEGKNFVLPFTYPQHIEEAIEDLDEQLKSLDDAEKSRLGDAIKRCWERNREFNDPEQPLTGAVLLFKDSSDGNDKLPMQRRVITSNHGYGLNGGRGTRVSGWQGTVRRGYQAVFLFFMDEERTRAKAVGVNNPQIIAEIVKDLKEQRRLAEAYLREKDENERAAARQVKQTLHQAGVHNF